MAALNVSLRWLQDYKIIMMCFGFVGGPLAYFAGSKLGAMTFHNQTAALLLFAFAWALFMPVLFRLAAYSETWVIDKNLAKGAQHV